MACRLAACGVVALGLARAGVPDPPPAPQPVTRADVERLLARARRPMPDLCLLPGVEVCGCQDDPGSPPPPDMSRPPTARYEYRFPEEVTPEAAALLRKADAASLDARRKRTAVVDDLTAANKMYRDATSVAAKSAYPWYRIAQNCQEMLEFLEAHEAIKRARQLDPRSAILLTEEGDIHHWRGDNKKAVECYDGAIGADPKLTIAYLNRASIRLQARDFAAARADAEKAVALDKQAPGAAGSVEAIDAEAAGGGFTGPDIVVRTTPHWEIRCGDESLATLLASHAEAIYGYYTERFPKADLGKVKFPVVVYKDFASYLKAGAPPNTGGYYSPGVRKLVLPVNPRDKWKPGQPATDKNLENTLLVLYHEGFHQFCHFGLERAPQWFNEGHGDFYGGARWEIGMTRKDGGKGYFRIGTNAWRFDFIQQMVKASQFEEIPRLMKMTQAEMYGPKAGPNYAQAWSIVYFLHTREEWGKVLLVPYYDALRKGHGLREAYARTFGKLNSISKFEESWRAFVRDLKKS